MEFTLLFLELFLKAMRLGFPLLAFFFLLITYMS